MSKETNNEMDVLLRRLGRRKQGSVSDADRIDDNHLDADDLSSYAENALPAAARTRYTKHLAECSRCRQLIVQLSSAVGVSTESIAETPAPSGLRKFLANLFSPMVLRYAVPALGLIVVAAIGFTILRQEKPASSVAQLKPEQQTNPPAILYGDSSPTPSRGMVEQQTKTTSPSAMPQTKQSDQAQPAPPPNIPPSVSVDAEVKETPPPPKVEQQPLANVPSAPAAAKPAAETDESRRQFEAEARRERVDESAKNEVRTTGEFNAARARAAKSKAQPSDSVSAPGAASVGNLQRGGVDKDDAGETRAVAGRRFRKQRGIWIDTAYESSMRTTNLTRGSEQYRALIADEPAIKSIAEQLDGEIVVVWNGRAYRIR